MTLKVKTGLTPISPRNCWWRLRTRQSLEKLLQKLIEGVMERPYIVCGSGLADRKGRPVRHLPIPG